MALFTVTNLNESGAGSLRQAILDANLVSGADVINFSVSGSIRLLTEGLTITEDLTINGDTDGDGAADISIIGSVGGFNITGTNTNVELRNLNISTQLNQPEGGGAINLAAGNSLNLVNSMIFNSQAQAGNGGAIYSAGDLTVTNSTLTGNVAANSGGAIYQAAGTLSLVNTTISGNNAPESDGGGIFIAAGVTSATIENSTIVSNTAGSELNGTEADGGGIYNLSSALTITNSVVAENLSVTSVSGSYSQLPDDVSGTIDAAQNSFFGSGVSITSNTSSTVNGGDPMLAALADNGGPVMTHAILPGSPLIGAGNAALLPADPFDVDGDANLIETLPRDANGFDRIQVALDIGATEAEQDAFTNDISTTGAINAERRPVISAIDFSGDEDWIKVNLLAGVTYEIDLEGSTNSMGTLDDPSLLGIYDVNGDLIPGTSDDNSGAGADSSVTFTALTTGDHYISAGASGANTGTYRLSVVAESVTLLDTNDVVVDVYTTVADAVANASDGYTISVDETLYSHVGVEFVSAYQNNLNFVSGDIGGLTFLLYYSDPGVRTFTQSGGADLFVIGVGSDQDDYIVGGDGENSLQGGGGENTIFGGAGDDYIQTVNNAKDIVDAGAGDDTVEVFDNVLGDGDIFDGGSGRDLLDVRNFDVDSLLNLQTGLWSTDVNNIISYETITNFEDVRGGSGNDSILGTDGANNLEGADGNDFISGGDGGDVLWGQAGNDTLVGGDGNDTLYGGFGDNSMNAGGGINFVSGHDGNDTLYEGFDSSGVSGSGTMNGGGGDDLFIITSDIFGDNDYFSAGSGIDTLDLSALGAGGGGTATIFLDLDEGFLKYLNTNSRDIAIRFENVIGSQNSDQFIGTSERNVISGEAGDDTIDGLDGDDFLIGGAGDDFLTGGAGADRMEGGTGQDTVSYATASERVNLDLRSRGTAGEAVNDTFASIEVVLGSDFGDYIYGDNANNVIHGNAGNDLLRGHNGNDTLIGGTGADNLNGGSGRDLASYADASERVNLDLRSRGTAGEATNDTFASIEDVLGSDFGDYIYGDNANNVINGGAGDDLLRGHNGNDVLIGGIGADNLNGGSGVDLVIYADASERVNLDLRSRGTAGEATNDTFVSIEAVLGSNFGDYIYGDNANNIIHGGAGDDLLRGHNGNDVLIGGIGADNLNGGSGVDLVAYDDASERVNLDLRSRGTAGDAANDTFVSIENVLGSDFGDYVYGDNANNLIDGGAGDDRLRGHNGNDTLIGGDGNDNLNGGSGVDLFIFEGDTGNDVISGFQNDVDIIHVFAMGGTVSQDGTSAVVQFDNGGRLEVENMSANALLDDIFFF